MDGTLTPYDLVRTVPEWRKLALASVRRRTAAAGQATVRCDDQERATAVACQNTIAARRRRGTSPRRPRAPGTIPRAVSSPFSVRCRTAGRCRHDTEPTAVQYRSADGCFHLQVAAIFLTQPATGYYRSRAGPGAARQMTGAAPESAHSSPLGNSMNMMMMPAPVPPGCARDDLMTRRQVALLFRVTSAAVASWARRGRLPEVRDEAGRPRYRRADVETLFRSGTRWRAR